eukprot:gene21300-biopygen5658
MNRFRTTTHPARGKLWAALQPFLGEARAAAVLPAAAGGRDLEIGVRRLPATPRPPPQMPQSSCDNRCRHPPLPPRPRPLPRAAGTFRGPWAASQQLRNHRERGLAVALWEKRQRTRTGRGPDAGRTMQYKQTDADRTRIGRGRGLFSLWIGGPGYCPGDQVIRVRAFQIVPWIVPGPPRSPAGRHWRNRAPGDSGGPGRSRAAGHWPHRA